MKILNQYRRPVMTLAVVLAALSSTQRSPAFPLFQDQFNNDPQFVATASTEVHSITASNADNLFTVSAWADQASTVPANIFQFFLFIGVDSGVGNGALIDGSESMTLQLDNSVGASWISFNWTGGSGGSSNGSNIARVHISGFKSDPGASAVVYSQPRISNLSYSSGTLTFDDAFDGPGNDYSQLLLANPAASAGATLTITGEPSPNGDATGWFVGLHELNIQEAVSGVEVNPSVIPQVPANTYATPDGAVVVRGYSDLNATVPANLSTYLDQCFGLATGSTVTGNGSVTFQFASGIGLSRLDSVYSGGHLTISGFVSDPGLVDPTSGATSSGYTNGVLTIALADGSVHPFFFTNRVASAGRTLRLNDTDSQFGIALVGYATIHTLLGPDITSDVSPTFATPDGLLTLTGYSDTPGTVPANLHENVNWFGIEGGNNTESIDGTESMNAQFAAGTGLSGIGTRYTSGQIFISGFLSDPGFTDPSGIATGVSYSSGTLSYTFNAPHAPEVVVNFTNLSASAGRTLSFHTDGGAGSQLTLTRIIYASTAVPVPLSIARSGGNVVLTWPNGTLQEAPTVTGTYTNVIGATSPYTNAIVGTQGYFRVKVQ
jgi:hypothetical protein